MMFQWRIGAKIFYWKDRILLLFTSYNVDNKILHYLNLINCPYVKILFAIAFANNNINSL
jgi:hypothetical protein